MPEPMYRRIAEDLRQKIESGELPRGTQLPTEIELREQYDAARNTVRDAIRWLTSRGLVETRLGHGTFVVAKVQPFLTSLLTVPDRIPDGEEMGLGGEATAYAAEVRAQGRRPEKGRPRVEIQQPTELVMRELRLGADASVVSRHQERRIDGTPYSLQTTFYPMEFVERGAVALIQAHDIPNAVTYLEEELGIRQVGWRDRITVRVPDARESGFFGLPDDGRIAVFETFRTGFSDSGRPLRLTLTTYPTDRNQFVLTVGAVPPSPPAPTRAADDPGGARASGG